MIMTLELVRSTLGWCALINMGLLLLWLIFMTAAHDWIYRVHCRWFRLSEEKLDCIHYSGMAIFKIRIFVFNLVPYFALRIVG
jgi:hypothetical protein